MPSEVFLLPAGLMEARITLPADFEANDQEVTLFASVPSILGVSPDFFALGSHHAPCIAVLTGQGIYVLRRDHGMTVGDVITIINHHIGIRCSHLVGMLGERHQEQTICPNAVIARDRENGGGQFADFGICHTKCQRGHYQFHVITCSIEGVCGLFTGHWTFGDVASSRMAFCDRCGKFHPRQD